MTLRNRQLRREAERLIVEEGILNDVEVLQSVLRLGPKRDTRGRYSWGYVCEVIDASYLLGLRIGAHFAVLPSVKEGRVAR